MDNTIDSIQLEIEVSASKAVENINGLTSSLKKLDRLGKSDGLIKLKQNLQGLGRVRLNKLETQLANIEKHVQSLSRVQKALRAFDASTPGINTEETRGSLENLVEEVEGAQQEIRQVLEEFGSGQTTETWRDEIKKSCTEMLDGFTTASSEVISARDKLRALLESKESKFANDKKFQSASTFESSINDELAKANNQAKILQATLDEMSSRAKPPSAEEWRRFENQLISLKQRYAGLISQANSYNAAVDSLGKKAAGSAGLVKRLFDKFKNVAFYRLIRRVLQQISQAAKEGLRNIAQFSEQANGVLSQYKTQGLYLQNSFGSALLPILQSLLPTIIRLSDALSDILNSVGMISAAINGSKTFIRAKKSAQDYAEALNNVNKATLGIDELNVLDANASNANYADMFEEVELSGWDIAGSVAKISALVASITALVILIKGAKLKEIFKTIGTSLKSGYKFLGDMKTWQKGIAAIALLAVEAVAVHNAFYDATKGTKSWGQALLTVIPVMAAVGVAMYAMMGPVGLVIGLLVGVVAAISGVVKAQEELKYENAMADFFKVSGVEISKVTGLLDTYFRSINIDKQAEWNETLKDASDNLMQAAKDYDYLWRQIAKCDQIDSTQIENLSTAFNNLADAANAVNDAAIGSIMASIKTGIELNITPELTAKLDGLLASLQTAQDLLRVKVSGIRAEYQQLLNEIANSGGNVTEEQRNKLNDLRSQINTFTLTDNTSSETWARNLDEAIAQGVNAGTNADEIKSAIADLLAKRDSYLETIALNRDTSMSTLKQLIQLDKTEFGGALGFKDSDVDTLQASYEAQVAAVHEQYNKVLDAIIQNYSNNAIKLEDIAGYKDESGENGWNNFWSNFGYGFLKGITFGIYESGDKKAYDEQQAFLEWLKNQKGYATGGQPESGEIFKAREDGIPELVGTIGHRTTVANNTQIIEGIKEGVYEAMQQAQGGNDDGEKTIHLTVNLDGKQVAEVVEKYNKRKAVGNTIYAGGVLNGI